MVLVWAGRHLVLARSLPTLPLCDELMEVGPLSSAARSQGPVLISCAQGLKNIPFGALSLPKHADWEYTFLYQLPRVFRQTHRHCEGPRKTIAEIGLTKKYRDLDWLGPIHRHFLIPSPFFELTWTCFRNALNLLFFSCPSKPCTS